MKRALPLILLTLSSCVSGGTPRPEATPLGPPTIDPAAIEAHADQFEEEVPEREAGTQQEFAAATYITGHLQQAGYVVEFDAVPVANTVRSTNVVALPPSTENPTHLVAIAYDSGSDPEALGAFLEVARALRADVPDHSVEFVALGAENAEVGGGALGSRRLVQVLKDRELDPEVIQIVGAGEDVWSADGPIEADFMCDGKVGGGGGGPRSPGSSSLCGGTSTEVAFDTFSEAGFERSLIAAPAETLATFLLDYLSR